MICLKCGSKLEPTPKDNVIVVWDDDRNILRHVLCKKCKYYNQFVYTRPDKASAIFEG